LKGSEEITSIVHIYFADGSQVLWYKMFAGVPE
jgi:hypothetical protein